MTQTYTGRHTHTQAHTHKRTQTRAIIYTSNSIYLVKYLGTLKGAFFAAENTKHSNFYGHNNKGS